MKHLMQRLPVLVLLSLAILFSACGGSASTPPTPIPTTAPTTHPSATPTSGVSGKTLQEAFLSIRGSTSFLISAVPRCTRFAITHMAK